MDLVPYIYFEKQEPGSMLCAQHALNNLLQSPLWSPDNLADIARKLDSMEFSHLDNQNNNQTSPRLDNKSPNYDDSGFFSVQVIDDALHPLGLRIISWKSEEMKPMHDYPENQEAFILNHDLHWFTLRRFGQSVDRWYNLNSMAEDSPKWIGPTFLSMSIAQAEAEGYSIFAVVPLPPSSEPSAPQPGRLIACEADEQALVLSYTTTSSRISSGSNSSLRRPREEEEDEEVRDESSSSRTRMKLENGKEIHDLTYEDQLSIAIHASLTQSSSCTQNLSQLNHHEEEIGSINALSNHPSQPESSSTQPTNQSNPAMYNKSTGLSTENDEFESLEEKELALAISESLLDRTNLPSPSNSISIPPPANDQFVDEPTPDQLRQRRLARFSSHS